MIVTKDLESVEMLGDNMPLLEVVYDNNQTAVAMVMEDSYGDQVIVRIK